MFLTTIRNATPEVLDKANKIAQELGIVYVERGKSSIAKLKSQIMDSFVMIVHQDKLTIETEDTPLFFHPNMAQVRIKRLRDGGVDNMLLAMGLEKGMKVLDCTLGFAADAIVSAYGVGPSGIVDGLESNPYIAYLLKDGLKNYHASNVDLENSCRKINVLNANYKTYLQQLPDNSYDIVYFDPMFQHPLMNSENIMPLRGLANMEPLTLDALNEAKRVAKLRVVLKDNAYSKQFKKLGFHDLKGGKYSPIAYGVIENSKL